MRKANRSMIWTVLAVAATLAAAAAAFADWGRGWGHMGYGPHHGYRTGCSEAAGPGWQDGGRGYGPGRGGGRADLSQEQLERMEQQQEAFFSETEPLRQKLYEKEMALRSEMAKGNPDPDAAGRIQKEISELQGEFDQKRLEHRLEMRKIAPGVGRGPMGRGPGPVYGRGYGPGACWR